MRQVKGLWWLNHHKNHHNMRSLAGQVYKRFGGRDLKPDAPEPGTFYLRYEVDGLRHTLCLGTKDPVKAGQFAREHLGRIDRSDREAYLRSLVTLGKLAEAELAGRAKQRVSLPAEELWEKYESSHRRPQSGPGTMTGYKAQITRFSGWAGNRVRNLVTLNREQAEQYAADLERAFAPPTVRAHLMTLGRAWRVLLSDAKNPWEGLRPMGQHKVMSYRRLDLDELRTLARNAAAVGPEEHTLILIGYYTGLRLHDAATLVATAYDPGTATLTWVPSKTARRKPAPLVIPVMPELAARLGTIPEDGPILPRLAAEELSGNRSLSARMAMLIRDAGAGDTAAGKASFHSLRATFISMMDEAGAPQAVTDSITGHAPQTMHARYSHPSVDVAREWMTKALPRLDD